MKTLLAGCLVVSLCVSCGNGKKTADPFAALTQMVDSVGQKPHSESAVVDTMPFLRPLEADESFDDFIFNYASDKALQAQRTSFPLPYDQNGYLAYIQRADWEHDSLFVRDNIYTLLFDREQDMDIVADTALKSVQVEWLFLKQEEMKRYYFERTRGMWMLDSIALQKVKFAQGDFFPFYARFVTDSLYQRNHVRSPLRFITIDPDDDFSILETTLDVEQWFAFRPTMPSDWLSNICYGQRNEAKSSTKILKVNGIGNGYSSVFYFRKRQGEWQLYKYEDTSI